MIIVKNLERESLDFVGYKKEFTHRYAHAITKQVIHSDVINVAKNNKLTEEEVVCLPSLYTDWYSIFPQVP
ncbi:MAG: transposase family protein [Coleofasciculus sp. E2-BRE-01]